MNLKLDISDALAMHDCIQYMKSTPGHSKRRFLMHGFAGDNFYHKERSWSLKERVLDREHDLYKERIVDSQTSEIILFCEEPLSKHRGHGSAKKKRGGWPSRAPLR